MIRTAIGIWRSLRNAKSKHPDFPTKVCNTRTTHKSVRLGCEYWRRQNDGGRESVTSVLNEEVAEMLAEMYAGNWRNAEREWCDVIAVMIRIREHIRRESRNVRPADK